MKLDAYLIEYAAITTASVFNVLHGVVHYYGLEKQIPPKRVRWDDSL